MKYWIPLRGEGWHTCRVDKYKSDTFNPSGDASRHVGRIASVLVVDNRQQN